MKRVSRKPRITNSLHGSAPWFSLALSYQDGVPSVTSKTELERMFDPEHHQLLRSRGVDVDEEDKAKELRLDFRSSYYLERLFRFNYARLVSLQGLTFCGGAPLNGSIVRLPNLVKLHLVEVGLRNLPSFLGSLTALRDLNLRNNHLEKLPDSMPLTSLTDLDLSGNRFTTFPRVVESFARLEKLDISFNMLSDLPETFYFESLLDLGLDKNKFSMFPSVVTRCTSLTTLKLPHNSLREIDGEISKLSRLQHLNFWGNLLEFLPPSIGELSSLETLFLINNKLTTLPDSMVNLTALKKLCVDRNHLTSLPRGLESLPNLKIVWDLRGTLF